MKNFLITQNVSYDSKKGYQFSLSKDWFDYSAKIGINLIKSPNLNNAVAPPTPHLNAQVLAV